MIITATQAHGAKRRRPITVMQDTFYKAEWMESGDDPLLSPTMFLVEQPPNCTLVPHFHRQNQFQLFVDGAGTIGRDQIGAITVHYAGAYTGYGPLVSGPEGIKYFTIRPVLESGFTPITEAKEKMLRGPKRHAQSAPAPVCTAEQLAQLAGIEQETLIEPAPDGLGSTITRLPPGAPLHAAHIPGSAGQFLVVVAGTLRHGADEFGKWEGLFVSADEAPPPLAAGASGAQVVAMFTPPKDPAYP